MLEIISTKFVISPPFGNYIAARNCTRIMGSFTWQPRPGLTTQVIKTLRPVPGGWINQIGLRNCGIQNVRLLDKHIYSVVGLDDEEWERIWDFLPAGLRLEINLGCPNVHEYAIKQDILEAYCDKFPTIVKLPPTANEDMVQFCIDSGATHLHLCNTLLTSRGGLSGITLRPIVTNLIEQVSHKHPEVKIIAGGGIYSSADVEAYAMAGADHFSLSTIWFSPWRVPAVL